MPDVNNKIKFKKNQLFFKVIEEHKSRNMEGKKVWGEYFNRHN